MENMKEDKQMHIKGHDQKDRSEKCSDINDVPPPEFDEVRAIPLLTEARFKPSATDIGSGDINDPSLGTRVDAEHGRMIYMRFTSSLGNITIWRVTSQHFMFSTGEEGSRRYITAYDYNGKWYVVWKSGGSPEDVTENNMENDVRVWQVFHKFSKYFIRLEMMKQLYLHSVSGRLQILDVGDPENTRMVTPLEISLA